MHSAINRLKNPLIGRMFKNLSEPFILSVNVLADMHKNCMNFAFIVEQVRYIWNQEHLQSKKDSL